MDLPFDRTNIGLRERPVSSDINRAQSQIYRTITDLAQQMFGGSASPRSGFIGQALSINALSPAAMSVQVAAGMGFLYDATDLPSDIGATDLESVDDVSPYKPIVLNGPVTFAVPTAPAGPNTRIDIIEVRVNRLLVDSTPREQLDVPTKTFLPHSFYKTLSFSVDGFTGSVTTPAISTAALSYKIGAAGNPGVAPATTAGYVKLGEVHVGSGVTTIVAANLVDSRAPLGSSGAYLGRQVIAASGTYTPRPGTTRAVAELVGGGGGAGGVVGNAGQIACSGGGASGAYIKLELGDGLSLIEGGAVTIGAGGAGGSSAGTNGGNGGDTTLVVNSVSLTAKGGGGSGGSGVTSTSNFIGVPGAIPSGSSTGPTVSAISGSHGGFGAGTVIGGDARAYGGHGGSNPPGSGGAGGVNAEGGSAAGFGGGGGGSSSGSAGTARAGGYGSLGAIIIDEYL